VWYEFDLAKDGVNRTKHGGSLALAEVLFAGPHLALDDDRFDCGEKRQIAFGIFAADCSFASSSIGARRGGSYHCARPIRAR
jgi:uncharacterized DUF497 family protein